jgi:N-methylhydantoinase A
MLVADLRHDLVRTHLAAYAELSAEAAQAVLAPMLDEARHLLAADRVPQERQRIEMRVDMRYIGQSYELPLPLTAFTKADWAGLAPAFHAEHRRRFGHSDPQASVEIVSFAVTATGLIDTPELPRPAAGGREPPAEARQGMRRVYFESATPGGGGWHEAPVWHREALLAGNEIAGPAVIEEISATTVLYPGDRARLDKIGSLIVDIGS